jgi:hypothetical protein
MKPTKSQRRRRNEKVKKQQDAQWAAMGPAPPDDGESFGDGNLDWVLDIPSVEKAPAHMVDYDPQCEEDTPTFKQGAVKALSKAAGDERTRRADERDERLRALFPQYDGKRGGARKALKALQKQYEVDWEAGVTLDGEDPEPPPDLRTVQRALAPKNKKNAGAKK